MNRRLNDIEVRSGIGLALAVVALAGIVGIATRESIT